LLRDLYVFDRVWVAAFGFASFVALDLAIAQQQVVVLHYQRHQISETLTFSTSTVQFFLDNWVVVVFFFPVCRHAMHLPFQEMQQLDHNRFSKTLCPSSCRLPPLAPASLLPSSLLRRLCYPANTTVFLPSQAFSGVPACAVWTISSTVKSISLRLGAISGDYDFASNFALRQAFQPLDTYFALS
jgi:hypothetical protein